MCAMRLCLVCPIFHTRNPDRMSQIGKLMESRFSRRSRVNQLSVRAKKLPTQDTQAAVVTSTAYDTRRVRF